MPFPPRRWFSRSQDLAMERRQSLEIYLRAVLHTLVWNTKLAGDFGGDFSGDLDVDFSEDLSLDLDKWMAITGDLHSSRYAYP